MVHTGAKEKIKLQHNESEIIPYSSQEILIRIGWFYKTKIKLTIALHNIKIKSSNKYQKIIWIGSVIKLS